MYENHRSLGRAITFSPDSIGNPGSRYFYVDVVSEVGSVRMWMEKQQLLQVGAYLKQSLEGSLTSPVEWGVSTLDNSDVVSRDQWELYLVSMTTGFDAEESQFSIIVEGSDAGNDTTLWFSFDVDREQIDNCAEDAFEVCAAGRPRCVLCGSPIDANTEHVCARYNGHFPGVTWDSSG
jgi:uncharacterized repeat protein (TIGR03847 family)